MTSKADELLLKKIFGLIPTPEEFKKIAEKIYPPYDENGDRCYDEQYAHELSDSLMEDLLIQFGYGDGIKAIQDAIRWYA